MQEPTTVKEIVGFLREAVERRIPIHPGAWLDCAQKLAILVQDTDDAMIDAEMEYREIKTKFLELEMSGTESEARAKSSNAYRRFLGLKAERERISWTIQIAKKRIDLQNYDV